MSLATSLERTGMKDAKASEVLDFGSQMNRVLMNPGSASSSYDFLGCVDGYGRAHLLRLGSREPSSSAEPWEKEISRERITTEASASSGDHHGDAAATVNGGRYLSGASIEMAPPSSVSSRESGWVGIAMSAASSADRGGSYGRVTVATALHFGKAIAVYQMDAGGGEGPVPSTHSPSSPGGASGGVQPLRVFHTLGYPTALSWAGSVTGSPEAAVLAVAEESRVTLWDVRQVRVWN